MNTLAISLLPFAKVLGLAILLGKVPLGAAPGRNPLPKPAPSKTSMGFHAIGWSPGLARPEARLWNAGLAFPPAEEEGTTLRLVRTPGPDDPARDPDPRTVFLAGCRF
jgi:hypothetical protein